MLESSGLNHELLIGASFKVGKHDTTQLCSKGRPDLDTLKDPSTSKPQLGAQCQLHLASSQFAGSMVRLNREYCVKHGDHGLIYPSPFGGAFLFVCFPSHCSAPFFGRDSLSNLSRRPNKPKLHRLRVSMRRGKRSTSIF